MGSEMCIRDSPVISLEDLDEVIPEEEWHSPLPDAQGMEPVLSPVTISCILDQSSSDVLRQETSRQPIPSTDHSTPQHDANDASLPPPSGGT